MPAMQWGRAFQRSLALLVVASLLLSLFPIPVIASPTSPITTVLQQEGTPVPEPVPPPQWPEVGERAQYVPGAADLGSPEVLPAEPAVAVELQTEMEAFSAAAPAVPDLVLPAEPLEIVLEGGVQTAQMGGLPLALQTGDTVTGEPLTARVQMLQPEQAQEVSPLGLAFALQLQADAAGAQPLSASQSLTLVIDYSRIPSAQVSDVSSRLALYRASGCAVTPVALEADMLVPGNADELAAEALPPASIACTTWEQLPSYNDFAAQQLLAQLPEVTVTGAAPAPVTQGHTEPQAQPPAPQIYLPLVRGGSNAPSAQNTAPILPEQAASLLYLPLVSNRASSLPAGDQPSAVADTLYVLSTSASGANGDYSATPFNAVDDYQVGLFAGTFATSYPIAAPPAAAGAAPEISLVYDSGSAEGRSPIKNNQPGIVGMGWDLNTGAITRLFRACDPPIYTVPATLSTTLCPVASGYALTLNGISSRLIGQGNNRFRLQHDPLWQAELLTSTSVIHPDLTKRYWLVTTPDGVRYRFGGEEEPETGADQNSVFSANMGDGTNTWRWSLDRIEDPNGNIASYFYTLERSTSKGYIRAGHLNRIEYSKHTGRNTQPHARVLFNRELRCVNPANLTDCDTGDFYDTPLDLKCLNLSSGQCPPGPPSFWSQWRLDSIQTQIYDQGSGLWRTVTFYDLSYIFAGGNFYYRPMLLNSIIQRPGGNYQRTAFGHIEAPTYDSQSGALTLQDKVGSSYDFSETPYVYNASGASSYLVFRSLDFDAGANQAILRAATLNAGAQFELRLDGPSGTKIGELSTATAKTSAWNPIINLNGASGIHDLYVVFKQGGVYLNWLRFVPATSLPGLPPVNYSYVIMSSSDATYGNNMPRLSGIANQLGGSIRVTYGPSTACSSNFPSPIRPPSNCYPVYDPACDTHSPDEDCYVKGYRREVMKLEKWDSFSLNPSEVYTYTYSAPNWRYSDDPNLIDIRKSCPRGAAHTCVKRHWNDFRGHERVTVTDSSGAKTEYRFYRGMDGDRLNGAGGVYTATITLSDGSTRPDSNWLVGQIAEVRRFKPDGSVLARTVYWYTSTLTAGSVITGSYFTALQREEVTAYGSDQGAAGTHTTATSYEYDGYGNVTRQTLHGDLGTPADDRNVETGYVYNMAAYIVDKPQWRKLWAGTISGASGQEAAFSAFLYDGAIAVGTPPVKGNLTGTQSYWQASPSYEYIASSVAYDEYGRPVQVTDGRGNSTAMSYHPFYGYAERVTDALGHVTSSVVDSAWGVTTQTTDANGRVTALNYDEYGRLSAVWLPSEPVGGPPSYAFAYDPVSRPARVQSRQLQDASSGVYLENWQFVDGFGRTVQTQTPSATGSSRIVTSRQYNGLGQLLHQSAAYELTGTAGSNYLPPNWATVASYHRFGYDELGNLWLDETKSQSSVLLSLVTIHDSWQRRQYDPNGRRTDYDVDAFGNLARVVEYNTGSAVYATSYSYNLAGSLTQVTDAAGNLTSMSYDLLRRKTSMDDPDMGQWQYRYDAAGNLLAQQDGRGLWLHLGYDSLNRLVSKRQDDPTTGALIAEYVYDAPGQAGLLSKSRAYSSAGVVEVQAVTYDSRNQVSQQQWLVPGADGGTFRTAAAYNAAGQKTSFTYPGGRAAQLGEAVSYRYNGVGQLTGVSGVVDGATIEYLSAATYNAKGQPLELRNDTGAKGLTRQYVYESNTGRLSVVKGGKSSPFTGLQELTYRYDNNGNITSLVDGRNGGQQQCFRYDWLDRLTGAFTGDATCSAYSASGVGAYNHSYSYDTTGNLTKYAGNTYTYGAVNDQPHAVRSAFGNSYGYDGSGNQTNRTIAGVAYTLHYDYENRLVAVKQGATVIASFLYDADGNRVKGVVGGVTTVYIAGVYEQTGASTIHYYAEAGAMRRAGFAGSNGVFYLLSDQLQSTSVIATQAGVEAARQSYYPYGGKRGGSAFSDLTTKRFTGQYHEANLAGAEGLSYYNARWYDPQLGRFVSPDTIVPNPADPQDLNRYTYAGNNPVLYNDPSGHCPLCQIITWGIRAIGVGFGLTAAVSSRAATVVGRYAPVIVRAAKDQGLQPMMLGMIIDHESGNIGRGLPDYPIVGVEKFTGRSGSYGVGQVKLYVAEMLENAGYMPKQANNGERFFALMDDATNIKYAAAKLAYDKVQIQAWYQRQGLPISKETLNRLTMVSYNIGWNDPHTGTDLLDNLETYMHNPVMGGLAALTESLAYQGTLTDGTPISQYHISEMWNNDRMSLVEQALKVDCSEWWTR